MSNPNFLHNFYQRANDILNLNNKKGKDDNETDSKNAQQRLKETSNSMIVNSVFSALAGMPEFGKQAAIHAELEGLQFTKTVSDYLDECIANNPIISQAYSVFLNAADTEFDLDIEVGGKGKQDKLYLELEEDFPKLFPGCLSVRDVSKLFMDKALTSGLIAFQGYTNTETGLIEFVFPPAHTLKWTYTEPSWELVQDIRGERNFLDTDFNFIYKPLFPLRATNEGFWFVPPFKAGLKAALEYELLRESERQIAKRTGMQVIFDVAYKVLDLPDWLTKSGGEKETTKNIVSRIASFYTTLKNYMQNGFIMRTDEYDIKPLQTVEPPAHIQMFDQLFAQRVIAGCKSYAPFIGYMGKENQTTLSSAQMKPVYNFCTSLQDTADHALKKAIFMYASNKGYVIKHNQIKRQKPVLDSLLDYAKAEQILLQVQIAKEAMETKENVQTGGNEDINESASSQKATPEKEAPKNTESGKKDGKLEEGKI